jgi:hypothetical protein
MITSAIKTTKNIMVATMRTFSPRLRLGVLVTQGITPIFSKTIPDIKHYESPMLAQH